MGRRQEEEWSLLGCDLRFVLLGLGLQYTSFDCLQVDSPGTFLWRCPRCSSQWRAGSPPHPPPRGSGQTACHAPQCSSEGSTGFNRLNNVISKRIFTKLTHTKTVSDCRMVMGLGFEKGFGVLVASKRSLMVSEIELESFGGTCSLANKSLRVLYIDLVWLELQPAARLCLCCRHSKRGSLENLNTGGFFKEG